MGEKPIAFCVKVINGEVFAVELHTKFYGTVSYTDNETIQFPGGLPGFEERRSFLYLHPEDSIFGCLQSVEEPQLAFVVISPYVICPDYSINLPSDDTKALKLNAAEDALILAIVSIREKLDESSANLQAPVIIHMKDRTGRQVLLPDSGYPVRYPLWKKDGSASSRCS